MIIAILAASVAAFYLGAMAGCWLAGRGRVSAYLEGAEDGIGFEKRRVLSQPQAPAKTFDSEELGAA